MDISKLFHSSKDIREHESVLEHELVREMVSLVQVLEGVICSKTAKIAKSVKRIRELEVSNKTLRREPRRMEEEGDDQCEERAKREREESLPAFENTLGKIFGKIQTTIS